jgi:hypothetical protein
MPPADNTRYLREATTRRHDETVRRAKKAIRDAARAGAPITFRSIAAAAGVSKSWLYTQGDIRTEIERLRAVTGRSRAPAVPLGDRATEASLVRRVESLTEDNQRLRTLVVQLRGELLRRNDELALLHGELRQARQQSQRVDRSTSTS